MIMREKNIDLYANMEKKSQNKAIWFLHVYKKLNYIPLITKLLVRIWKSHFFDFFYLYRWTHLRFQEENKIGKI